MKKILDWIFNIILSLLIILTILVLTSRFNASSIGFGLKPLKVLSGSMEPAIKTGDLIIIKTIEDHKIKTGDIITYDAGLNNLVTHRVVEILNEKDGLRFKTKGDANNVQDKDYISGTNIIGKYLFRLPKLGFLSNIMVKPMGFLLFFILPIILLLGKETKSFRKI